MSMAAPNTAPEAESAAVIDLRAEQARRAAVVHVAVLDAQPVFRKGVRALLAEDSAIEVDADSDDMGRLAVALGSRIPDVFLCDVSIVAETGTLVSTLLHQRYPDSHVVVVSGAEDDMELARAVRGGARGYLLRDCTLTELHDTVIAAASGQSILAPSIASKLVDELATMVRRSEQGAEGVGSLSKREREVLGLVAEGLNNRAIAAPVFISENTVKNHVRNIHEKLGVHTRMEAVVRAVREGLLKIA